MRKIPKTYLIGCLLIAFVAISCSTPENTSVPDMNFNKGWLFMKGTVPNGNAIDLDDTDWRKLDLPHDWAIEGPFDIKHNARTGGLPVDGEAWYRKHFVIDKKHSGKQVSIEFDGAMSNAEVFINGEFAGERPYGYISFEVDLSSHIHFGNENIIAVKLAPEDLAARWYPGAGIYRNVRLKINHAIHIPQYGTFVTTPKVDKNSAEVNIETTIKNASGKDEKVKVRTQILNSSGAVLVENEKVVSTKANNSIIENISLKVNKPKMWSLESPELYQVLTSIELNDEIIDEYSTSFGIRTIEFSREEGFLLNGKAVELNGVCLHHDHGPLGSAVNYRAAERQVQIMKSMGVNAIRTSHNPPSPELLTACDRLGVVVIDEAFDEWQMGKVPNGYNKHFDEWHEIDLRDMIKRDRNHPSVIMWSIGNEILEQSREDGWKLTKHLNDICHDQDSTRPTTIGFNYFPAPFVNKLAYQVDIVGMNYWPEQYQNILDENPEMIIYGSETSSMTSSRGVYHLPIEFTEKHETNHASSYDVIVGPPWAYPPDVEFDCQDKAPQSLGEFMWTGFDYIGEPTPYGGRDNSTNGYWNDDWPSHSSYFAPVDLCGFPKDRYYLYQSQWTTEPMVHLLPHWNWSGMEDKEIPVYVYTNCEEAELFLNGESLGKKTKGVDITKIPADYHDFDRNLYPSKYRLSWNVPYKPGTLKVVAYTAGETKVAKEIHTAGQPAKIVLKADRTSIKADGADLSYITVSIEDEEGNICPMANNLVEFNVTGAGTIASVGNGDPTCLEPHKSDKRSAFSGKCLLIVQSTDKAGEIRIEATSGILDAAALNLKTN